MSRAWVWRLGSFTNLTDQPFVVVMISGAYSIYDTLGNEYALTAGQVPVGYVMPKWTLKGGNAFLGYYWGEPV